MHFGFVGICHQLVAEFFMRQGSDALPNVAAQQSLQRI